jgi:formylglycine-generating enzyme required for sulfatase activity
MRLVAVLLIALAFAAPRVAGAQEHPDREFRECTQCPEMVGIPAGQFTMGSPAKEPGRFDSEGPQHGVAIRAFALSKYLVTSEQFLIFLRATGYQPAPCNPILGLVWHSQGHGLAYPPGWVEPPRTPAVCLSWRDAGAYISWLNAQIPAHDARGSSTGGPYRLPSEAEWEYAARAGTTAARWWGDTIGVNHANCNGCGSQWDGREIAPVDSFAPNPFGLYDMLGNAWQWTEDCWHESYVGAPSDGSPWLTGDCGKRVLRGGSWSNVAVFVRAAARSHADAQGRDFDYSIYAGIRVARTLP